MKNNNDFEEEEYKVYCEVIKALNTLLDHNKNVGDVLKILYISELTIYKKLLANNEKSHIIHTINSAHATLIQQVIEEDNEEW